MNDEQTTYQYYALSIKGGFYDALGRVVDNFDDAFLFKSQDKAIAFRKRYDPINRIDCAILLSVQVLVSEV